MLSACHEKYTQISQNAQAKKSKKKDNKSQHESIQNSFTTLLRNDKQCLQVIVQLMRHLKQNYQNCTNAISELIKSLLFLLFC